jgi:glucose uptake protein GlcU
MAVILLMAAFPPTQHGTYYRALFGGFGRDKEVKPLGHVFHPGYTFLLVTEASNIGLGKLIVQWAVVALITGAFIYKYKGKKDNKRQEICLWIGIATIVLMGIFPPVDKPVPVGKLIEWSVFFTAKSWEIEYATLFGQWSIVGALTGGLIYAYKDKKRKESGGEEKQ